MTAPPFPSFFELQTFAHLIYRLDSGKDPRPRIEEFDDLSPEASFIVQNVLNSNGEGPSVAFHRAVSTRPDGAEIESQVLKLDPLQAPSRGRSSVPLLPAYSGFDPSLASQAGALVDLYARYGARVAPMTPRLFHESAWYWLISTTIARRLVVKMSYADVYPNLAIAWVAPTTFFKKTTALDVARKLARRWLSSLLAPQEVTPEAFLSDLAGIEPHRFDQMTADAQQRWKERRNYAAQRGLLLDEMSSLLSSSGKDYNAGLIETLLRLYDCDQEYSRLTRGLGMVTIKNSYLTFLGASTPLSVASHLTAPRLWSMGFWPRFSLLTPEDMQPAWQEPADDVQEPEDLGAKLRLLSERLPAAVWPDSPAPITVTIAPDAFQLWRWFNKTTSYDMLMADGGAGIDERLHGTYGRLPTQVIKIATCLAALDWERDQTVPRIGLAHMTRAIVTADQWRASAHRALDLASANEASIKLRRLVAQLSKFGSVGGTMRDLCRNMRDLSPSEIWETVEQGLLSGEVEEVATGSSTEAPKRGRPSGGRFRLITQRPA